MQTTLQQEHRKYHTLPKNNTNRTRISTFTAVQMFNQSLFQLLLNSCIQKDKTHRSRGAGAFTAYSAIIWGVVGAP